MLHANESGKNVENPRKVEVDGPDDDEKSGDEERDDELGEFRTVLAICERNSWFEVKLFYFLSSKFKK